VSAVALLVALLPAQARQVPPSGLPRGTIVDSVASLDDPRETYALYLPSDYTADRVWNLLIAFHPAARGREFVATYREAAERYGYIVAGSNTSRNGPWDGATRAVRALSRDLGRRFAIDADRVYVTGHSGGARLAMEVGLANHLAGVIASSAGFADARPRRSVRFPVFATAGIDDFNYRELRRLDDTLTSPHYLAVFAGAHTLPPAAVALQAIEWLELQAMRSGHRAPDAALVDALYGKRLTEADGTTDVAARLHRLQAVVADFAGLRDVSATRARAEALAREEGTRRAVARDRADLDAEGRMLDEALADEVRLARADTRAAALAALDVRLAAWSRTAHAAEPSGDRSRARRLLGALAGGAAGRTGDPEYQDLLRRYRWAG
jgi:hypothetical protein